MPWIKFNPPLAAADFPGLESAGFRTVHAADGWLYGLFPSILNAVLQTKYSMVLSPARVIRCGWKP